MLNTPDQFVRHVYEDDVISLSDIINTLLCNKKIIIFTTLFFFFCACLYLLTTKPVYTIKAEIYFEDKNTKLMYSIRGLEKLERKFLLDTTADVLKIKSADFISQVFSDVPNTGVDSIVDRLQVTHKQSGVVMTITSASHHSGVNELNKIMNYFVEDKKIDFKKSVKSLMNIYKLQADSIEHYTAVKNEVARLTQSLQYQIVAPTLVGSTPKSRLIIFSSLVLGLMVGIIAALIREATRKTFLDPKELERKTGLDVLEVNSEASDDVSKRHCISRRESLRMLRTNVLHKLSLGKNNRVMICYPSPSDKTDDVIADVASVFALSGIKTLLINGDLEKHKTYAPLNIESLKGVGDCLVKSDHSSPVKVNEFLNVIPGDGCSDNYRELLVSKDFIEYLKESSIDYDVILIDAPPVLSGADAAIIGNACSLTLMLVNSRSTTSEEVMLARTSLKKAGVTIDSCILNFD